MKQNLTVSEIRSFTYLVVPENGNPTLDHPVGRLTIQETKLARSRTGLIDTPPEYGFRLLDSEGNVVAEIAPGYWPFFRKVVEVAAPQHSPACEEDCHTEMGNLAVVVGAASNDE